MRVGRRLGVSHVVVAAIGGLGDTYVVQLRLIQVATGAAIRSVEETLFGGLQALPGQSERIAGRLFGAQRRARWYEHWWLWTAVAAAATVAVVVPVVVSAGQDGHEDVPLP